MISPLPAFVSCHKKSHEKNRMLAQISFNFLIALFVTNAAWLAYAIRIHNMDIMVINSLGFVVSFCFCIMYLYVKLKVCVPYKELSLFTMAFPFNVLMFSQLLTT